MYVQLFASASITDGFSKFDKFFTKNIYLRLQRKKVLNAFFQNDKG